MKLRKNIESVFRPRKNNLLRNIILFLVAFFLIIVGIAMVWLSTVKIPDLNSLQEWRISESTKILDRTGKVLLYDVHENIKRTVVTLDKISPNAQKTTIAMEDSRFYQHMGIDPKAVIRMIFVNLGSREFSQGGSTITQQVVKNAFLTPEKTVTRKIKEWIVAIKLEQVLSKDKILELYFNEVPYGGNIYGIEEAAQAFFGKHASDLTLAESAYLAALTPAPTYYSPYGNNKKELDKKQQMVLARMLELDLITEEEYKDAENDVITFKPQTETSGIEAPHFVVMVKQYLEEKYGRDMVENGGLRITTTLDAGLQSKAEDIVKEYGNINASAFNASNAAAVGIDPKTGQVLVMVGSRDYFNKNIDGNFNVALSPNRQPGSSFKPFVYATAFEKGYTPETVVFDVPTEFNTKCSVEGIPSSPDTKPEECYMPENYDNEYRGPISLRNALAQSVNVPAVKMYYLAGPQDSINTARSMGITTLKSAKQYGLTLVLGSGEVSLYDMTGAYGVFANNGVKNNTAYILKVEDGSGKVLEEYEPEPNEILDKNISLQITDILSDNVARAPLYDTTSPLHFPERQVAVKTGTTNDYRDAWIIGYTPSIVVGVWAGNNNNTPMEKKISGLIVAPMWRAIMDEALRKLPVETYEKPIPSAPEKPILRGDWRSGGYHTILAFVDKDDPLGPPPANPGNDSQYWLWEYPIRIWAGQNPGNPGIFQPLSAPATQSQSDAPKIVLVSPQPGSTYTVGQKVPVSFQGSSKYAMSRAEMYINGVIAQTLYSPPFDFSFYPGHIRSIQNDNTLKIVVYDTNGNRSQLSTTFSVQK
ncbi:MAG: penicillin-binding protein [Candidatus Paceibacterota bacterium]|jgi:1A family penicillin-binding protein|nr:penicillin-binding protein [Candidatus Paceibacterota bacterium]